MYVLYVRTITYHYIVGRCITKYADFVRVHELRYGDCDDCFVLQAAPYCIRGCILTMVERMDDEFVKMLQACDAHSTEYIDRWVASLGRWVYLGGCAYLSGLVSLGVWVYLCVWVYFGWWVYLGGWPTFVCGSTLVGGWPTLVGWSALVCGSTLVGVPTLVG